MFSFTIIKKHSPYRLSIRSPLRFFSPLPLSVISAWDFIRRINARRFFGALHFLDLYRLRALRLVVRINYRRVIFPLFISYKLYYTFSFRVIACEVLSADKTAEKAEERTKNARVSPHFCIINQALPVPALLLLIPPARRSYGNYAAFRSGTRQRNKLWTETADWTMSQKIAPESLPRTVTTYAVAARDTKKIDKALENGQKARSRNNG